MEILIYAGQLILGLSILVALHEFGHFLPAKLFGMRVEKFFLFFDWPRALVQWKKGDTTYGLGALPFGGYVKISGMIDESMDQEQKERMSKPAEPWEFRAKPVWQRLIVMVGGVTVNVILGFLIYSMVLFVWGREYLPIENIPFGVSPSPLMKAQGFADGDRIRGVEGAEVKTLEDLSLAVLLNDVRIVHVERDGRDIDIKLSDDVAQRMLDSTDKVQFTPLFPFFVDSVVPGNSADKARSFRKGDHVVAVDDTPTPYFQQFVSYLSAHRSRTLDITVLREGHTVIVPVDVDADGRVGLRCRDMSDVFKTEVKHYSLLESIPAGVKHGWQRMKDNVSSFKLLGTKSGVKQMGGLVSMANAYGNEWVWRRFWEMTAFLSMALAFLNILPIPALDGGHVVFLLYEAVARRPAPPKVLEYAQMAGMAFLLTVILAVNGHDIFKLITGRL